MINYFKNSHRLRPHWTFLFVLLVIGSVSIVPIINSLHLLKIGGDVILPLIPNFALRNAFDWVDYINGSYYSTDYFIWISFFYLLHKASFTIYQSAFIFQFLIYFFSGLGIYMLFNLYNEKNKLWGLIPAVAFIYSPHRYDHMVFFYATASSIWLIYFLMKFIKTKTFTLADVIWISLLVGLMGNLPNPKYHFLVFLIYSLVTVLALYLRVLSWETIKKNIPYVCLIVASTTYISLPYIYYGIHFSKDASQAISVQNVSGQTLDYGSALVSKMMTLWHSPSLNVPDVAQMNSPIFLSSYYLFPLLVIGFFPFLLFFFQKKERYIYAIYYSLTLIFILLAKGPNPPFGFAYNWVVGHIKIFAFLRTTSGMVIYVAIFYTIIFGKMVQFLGEKFESYRLPIIVSSLLLILVSGYHIWSGAYSRNFSVVNKQIDSSAYGLTIPESYYKSTYFLSNLRRDTKIRIAPGVSSYQNNTWGYFGPIIYPWYISKPTVSLDSQQDDYVYDNLINTAYVYHDKTLINDKGKITPMNQKLVEKGKRIYTSKDIDIYRRNEKDVKPRFYLKHAKTASIEYKRINPTKYRLRIHNTRKKLRLIFTDNFHEKWSIYTANYIQEKNANFNLSAYTILPYNKSDQASQEELSSFMGKNMISTLGNQFVSKLYDGTIQNDNLPNGTIFETIFKKKVATETHYKADIHLNGWVLDVDTLCQRPDVCKKNPDGTKDIELLVEFSPQLLTYMGYCISGVSILGILLLYFFKQNSKHGKKI